MTESEAFYIIRNIPVLSELKRLNRYLVKPNFSGERSSNDD